MNASKVSIRPQLSPQLMCRCRGNAPLSIISTNNVQIVTHDECVWNSPQLELILVK